MRERDGTEWSERLSFRLRFASADRKALLLPDAGKGGMKRSRLWRDEAARGSKAMTFHLRAPACLIGVTKAGRLDAAVLGIIRSAWRGLGLSASLAPKAFSRTPFPQWGQVIV
jgi:hypothetical protein